MWAGPGRRSHRLRPAWVALTPPPPHPRPGLLSASAQPPRPKPPVPAKPQLPPEVYTTPAPRPRPAPPPKPSHPIYQEPDEAIDFYAMGRGSPGEAPGNVYAEVEAEAPAGAGGASCVLGHPALRKCRSRPVPGGQVTGCREEATAFWSLSLSSPSHLYPALCLEPWVQPSPLTGSWGLSRAGALPATFTAPPS